eukprot:jgi/Botrbrau1/4547/Bobra.60_2s0034.1
MDSNMPHFGQPQLTFPQDSTGMRQHPHMSQGEHYQQDTYMVPVGPPAGPPENMQYNHGPHQPPYNHYAPGPGPGQAGMQGDPNGQFQAGGHPHHAPGPSQGLGHPGPSSGPSQDTGVLRIGPQSQVLVQRLVLSAGLDQLRSQSIMAENMLLSTQGQLKRKRWRAAVVSVQGIARLIQSMMFERWRPPHIAENEEEILKKLAGDLDNPAQREEYLAAINELWQAQRFPGVRKTPEQRNEYLHVAWNSFLVFLSVCERVYLLLEQDAKSFGDFARSQHRWGFLSSLLTADAALGLGESRLQNHPGPEVRILSDLWKDLKAVHTMAVRLGDGFVPSRGPQSPPAPNDARKTISSSLEKLSNSLTFLQELLPQDGDLTYDDVFYMKREAWNLCNDAKLYHWEQDYFKQAQAMLAYVTRVATFLDYILVNPRTPRSIRGRSDIVRAVPVPPRG